MPSMRVSLLAVSVRTGSSSTVMELVDDLGAFTQDVRKLTLLRKKNRKLKVILLTGVLSAKTLQILRVPHKFSYLETLPCSRISIVTFLNFSFFKSATCKALSSSIPVTSSPDQIAALIPAKSLTSLKDSGIREFLC
jgi:hypothetical protein